MIFFYICIIFLINYKTVRKKWNSVFSTIPFSLISKTKRIYLPLCLSINKSLITSIIYCREDPLIYSHGWGIRTNPTHSGNVISRKFQNRQHYLGHPTQGFYHHCDHSYILQVEKSDHQLAPLLWEICKLFGMENQQTNFQMESLQKCSSRIE